MVGKSFLDINTSEPAIGMIRMKGMIYGSGSIKGQEGGRSTASCAACKFLKRKCVPTCIFAPYFRADELRKFAKVHKVFGASNVSKILTEVPEERRADTVNSLVYEADARLRDPVFGCIGAIALLQRRMVQLQHDLAIARARLARYNNNNNIINYSPTGVSIHQCPSTSLFYGSNDHHHAFGHSSPSSSSSSKLNSCLSDQFEVPVGSGTLMMPGTSSASILGLQQQFGSFDVSDGTWLPP